MSRPEEMTAQEGIEAILPRNVAGRAVEEGKGKMSYWSLTWAVACIYHGCSEAVPDVDRVFWHYMSKMASREAEAIGGLWGSA
jgi:hypothetical protein